VSESTLEMALAYARRGWLVVPLHRPGVSSEGTICTCRNDHCASIGKHPLTRHGAKDASRDVARIESWWARCSWANVGIATGAASGLVVLDIDPRHGGDDSLVELEREQGKLPATPIVLTGGGGQHLYFRHPGGRVVSATGIRPGVDVRADGTLVVAPPSAHVSGRPYEWDAGYHADDTQLADAPAWLLMNCGRTGQVPARPAAYWRELASGPIQEGSRNDTIARFTGHLLAKGVDPLVALDLLRSHNLARCSPPLEDEEVVRTVNSIAGAQLRRGRRAR